jgi:hypothetical protein
MCRKESFVPAKDKVGGIDRSTDTHEHRHREAKAHGRVMRSDAQAAAQHNKLAVTDRSIAITT